MQSKFTFLDCTLRDGGYYNQWDFDLELVSFYLTAMGNAQVDVVEIGFRMLGQKGFFGPFAYSTDEFLNSLSIPKNITLGVMVNAKELISYADGPEAAVSSLFQPAKKSPVQFVRVAAHFTEIEKCAPVILELKKLGYRIGFNLMQSTGRTDEELAQAAQRVSSWNAIEVLYFADSLGNMEPQSIAKTVEALRKGWKGPIGFHAHDNQGQAMANCMEAIHQGVSWLDGTVLGMGRGAGNVRTEHLLIELQKRKLATCYPEAVFPIVVEHFEELKREYGWGMNLLYYLSASHGIHPTYVQELLQNQQFEPHHMMAAIEFLKNQKAASYSSNNLNQAVLHPQGASNGTWSATGWAKNRDMLFIAPGPGLKRHLDAIVRYINRQKPVVVCLNANEFFPTEKVTAYAACHHARLLLDSDLLSRIQKPLIVPAGMIPSVVQDKFKRLEIFNYGMKVQKDTFEFEATGCTLPTSLVAGYALALGLASNARRILMAGFDGFGPSDPRHSDMEMVLENYMKLKNRVPIFAITPTSYPITQSSIYSPEL